MNQTRGGPESVEQRRRFYRIDDEVVLQYREVPEEDVERLPQLLAERFPDSFTLGARFASLNQQLRPLLKEIEGDSPAVAKYVAAIDEKLDLLAQVLLARDTDLIDQPTRQVNLSAGGMAFFADQPLVPGAVLELRLILFPSFTGILVYGRVAYCRDQGAGDFRWRVAVEFLRMGEEERDLIVKHVLRKDAAKLLSRRDGG
jgi:hypothetical protein